MDEVPRAQDPDFLMEIMELNEEVTKNQVIKLINCIQFR